MQLSLSTATNFADKKTTHTSIALLLTSMALLGCQSTKVVQPIATTTLPTVTTPNASLPNRFNINGKIGITSPQQVGSAFYTWSQVDNNFGINLSGALGVGQTNIHYDGNTATITSEKINNSTHTLTARSPEELLQQVAGWQAPISQLPYWILGKYAPSDSNNQLDAQGRLSIANNSGWTANFNYDGDKPNLPSKITMNKPDGVKVVLTINHLK